MQVAIYIARYSLVIAMLCINHPIAYISNEMYTVLILYIAGYMWCVHTTSLEQECYK